MAGVRPRYASLTAVSLEHRHSSDHTSSSHSPAQFSQPPNLHISIISSQFSLFAALALHLWSRSPIYIIFSTNNGYAERVPTVMCAPCWAHSEDNFKNSENSALAPHSKQITTSAPRHSVFKGLMPFLPSNQQQQSTEGTFQ